MAYVTNDLFWCGIALKMDIDCQLKTHQVKCGGSVCYSRRCIDINVYNDNKICINYINIYIDNKFLFTCC